MRAIISIMTNFGRSSENQEVVRAILLIGGLRDGSASQVLGRQDVNHDLPFTMHLFDRLPFSGTWLNPIWQFRRESCPCRAEAVWFGSTW